ncbi:MAG TPA: ABC transporter substrate-binding protein [Mycobacteriales bacterium]|nr:ABC transporter substrate-binding protein [Mycobacteriales bacterium]
MLRNPRTAGWAAVAAIASVVIAACGSSSSGGSTSGGNGGQSGSQGGTLFSKLSTNATGTPKQGGVLKLAGSGDADYYDPNITYSSLGQSAARLYNRGLYAYSGQLGHTTEAVPDLATGDPVASNGGKTETVTIRQGADWDTTPKRQVTAADLIRGVEISCNPTSRQFGGQPDFSDLIVGYTKFCGQFAKAPATVAGIKSFLATAKFPGITVGSTPETVVFHLTQPAGYFESMLTLPVFSPRAVEMLNYLPGTTQQVQHQICDGPYIIKSFNPTKSIDFTRNPAWDPSTDPVRKAYVDEIKVTEGEQQDSIQQQILAGAINTDWDLAPSATQQNQLIQQNNPYLNVESEIASNPYIIFNTVSPNNNGALKNPVVRQALSYAINRAFLVQDAGGDKLEPPLTHVLPPQIDGAPTSTTTPYPYNPTKAKQMLASAGVKNLKLTFLYRAISSTSQKMYEDVQSQLSKIGVTVKGLNAPGQFTIYTKYLEVPSSARKGDWDLSLAGWGPDWYGNAALSFFKPLFYGKVLPPNSSDFGLYDDPAVDNLIDQAAAAQDESQSNALWAKADDQVIKDAAFYPIGDPNEGLLHSANTHNDVFMPAYQTFDYANIWLS